MLKKQSENWNLYLQLGLGLALAYLFYNMLEPFLVVLFLAATLAIVTYPLFRRLSRVVPRVFAALVITLGVALGALAPMAIALAELTYHLLHWIGQVRLGTAQVESFLATLPLQTVSKWLAPFLDPETRQWLESQVLHLSQALLSAFSGALLNFLGQVPSLFMGFAILLFSVFFLLLDGNSLLHFLAQLSPLSPKRTTDLYETFQQSCRGVVLGLFLSAGAQGLAYWIFLVIGRSPQPTLVATLVAITGLIPVVGSTPVWLGVVAYHLILHHMLVALFLLLGGLVISVTDNIVRTVFMRQKVAIHPLLVFMSVLGCVHFLGPIGLLIGPITAAVFISFLRMIAVEMRSGRMQLRTHDE